MNLLDGIIIIFVLLCMVMGSKRGVIRETVNVIGNIVLLALSFSLMGSVANMLYKFMPFLNLGLLDINLSALNILVYQIIAFAIVFFVLNLILRIILAVTNIVDLLLNLLAVVKPFSSFLGAIVGLLSGYITAFIILIILSVPFSSSKTFHESKLNSFILEKTPIFTSLTTNLRNATNDIYILTTTISNDTNKLSKANVYNLQILNIMLKYHIISIDTVDELIQKNKLGDISNLNSILYQYR